MLSASAAHLTTAHWAVELVFGCHTFLLPLLLALPACQPYVRGMATMPLIQHSRNL